MFDTPTSADDAVPPYPGADRMIGHLSARGMDPSSLRLSTTVADLSLFIGRGADGRLYSACFEPRGGAAGETHRDQLAANWQRQLGSPPMTAPMSTAQSPMPSPLSLLATRTPPWGGTDSSRSLNLTVDASL